MKVRWTNGSLRLRISPSELASLLRQETVAEKLAISTGGRNIPDGGWAIFLGATDTDSYLNAFGTSVTLRLSQADRETLADPATEGVYNEKNGTVFYVEKDFPCVHPRAAEAAEPPSETFAPPPGFEERKA